MKKTVEIKDGWMVCECCGKKLQRVKKSWIVLGVEIKCPRCNAILDVNIKGFEVGGVYMTIGVKEEISPDVCIEALKRHMNCDWGNLGEEDCRLNEVALVSGDRLLSSYQCENNDGDKTTIWIITEADRSHTTILLPSEY